MPKRVVIPNEVRDLTNGGGSRNQIRVSKTSAARSFPIRLRTDALRSGLRLFLQGSGACPELVEGLGMTSSRGLAFQPLHGKPHHLSRVFQIQFLFDVRTVGLDSFRADVEGFCNFPDVAA